VRHNGTSTRRRPDGFELGLLGCAVVTLPIWAPILLIVVLSSLVIMVVRRLRGWYGEGWYPAATVLDESAEDDLDVGQQVVATRGKWLHISKSVAGTTSDARRQVYRVRPGGVPWEVLGDGHRFKAAKLEVLEVVPGWRVYGPRGEAVLALLDQAKTLPLTAFSSFALEPLDPTAVQRDFVGTSLRREAERARISAWNVVWRRSQDDPKSGFEALMFEGPFWVITDPHWRNAERATCLAAIAIVIGDERPEWMAGWRHLRSAIG